MLRIDKRLARLFSNPFFVFKFRSNRVVFSSFEFHLYNVSLFVARWFAAIGAFRSSLLFRLLEVVPS